VTEPAAGADSSIRAFARREGDAYVVNGQKIWILCFSSLERKLRMWGCLEASLAMCF
jgi:hypothetical protein